MGSDAVVPEMVRGSQMYDDFMRLAENHRSPMYTKLLPIWRTKLVCESQVLLPEGAKLAQADHGPLREVAVQYLLSDVRREWVSEYVLRTVAI